MGARPRQRRRPASRRRIGRWLRRKKRSTHLLALAVVALSALLAAVFLHRSGPEHPAGRAPAGNTPPTSAWTATARRKPGTEPPGSLTRRGPQRPLVTAKVAPTPPAPKAGGRRTSPASADFSRIPRAALVIDDLGQNLTQLERLAELNIPLSIAVIPGLPATAKTVSEAARHGFEILLHQPMEPHEDGGKDAGNGVLLTSMPPGELRALLRANLAAVPEAIGVNNHMGSRFTEDGPALAVVMEELRESNLFWLDSRTTAATRGAEAARAAGVPAIERNIFIDAEVNVDFIRGQLRKLLEIARLRGTAVGIGHPHPETFAVLRELRGEILASGVSLVPISTLVRQSPLAEPGTSLARAATPKGPEGQPARSPGGEE